MGDFDHTGDTPPSGTPAVPPQPPREDRGLTGFIRRRPRTAFWSAAGIALLIGLGIGAAGAEEEGNNDSAAAEEELAAAQDEIARDRAASREDLEAVRGEIEEARETLEDEEGKVAAERRRLRRLEREVSGAQEAIERNTIPGTGTFVVGEDIEPGRYRAESSPGCYWARLSSLDTSDIIDNENADGPVVLEILPSDTAFQVSGCADFRRAGG